MTPEQATDLVDELIQAHADYECYGGKYYRAEYQEMKQKVIEALTASEMPSQQGNTP